MTNPAEKIRQVVEDNIIDLTSCAVTQEGIDVGDFYVQLDDTERLLRDLSNGILGAFAEYIEELDNEFKQNAEEHSDPEYRIACIRGTLKAISDMLKEARTSLTNNDE